MNPLYFSGDLWTEAMTTTKISRLAQLESAGDGKRDQARLYFVCLLTGLCCVFIGWLVLFMFFFLQINRNSTKSSSGPEETAQHWSCCSAHPLKSDMCFAIVINHVDIFTFSFFLSCF